MFNVNRIKRVALGLFFIGLSCDLSLVMGQERPAGFRSALGRMFGAKPPESADASQRSSNAERDFEKDESDSSARDRQSFNQESSSNPTKSTRSNPGPSSPRSRPSNARSSGANQSNGGLFGGGLFHQLRAVSKPDESETFKDEGGDTAPPQDDFPTAKTRPAPPPTIEPFSRPAVPPTSVNRDPYPSKSSQSGLSNVYAPPRNRYEVAGSTATQSATSRTSGDLPKIVRPEEYVKGTADSSTQSTASSSAGDSEMSPAFIKGQTAMLDPQSSSRRLRAAVPSNGSTVVSARKIEEEQSVAPKTEFSTMQEAVSATQDTANASKTTAAQSNADVFVSRRTPVTTGQFKTADAGMPIANSSQGSAGKASQVGTQSADVNAKSPLPDPISLPPSLSANNAQKPPATLPPPSNYRSPLKDLAQPSSSSTTAKVPATPTSSSSITNNASLPSASNPLPVNARNVPMATPTATTPTEPPSSQVTPDSSSSPTSLANGNPDGQLMQMQIPSLRLWVEGPEKIRVDRPSPFKILARNEGKEGVVGLLVNALVPPGVSASGMKSNAGTIEAETLDDKSQSLLWQLAELSPGQTRELVLDMAASKPENFGLEIEWTVMPQSDIANVQPIQPQLLLGLEGPSEVLYGKPEIYKLILRNPGNAPVEEVNLELNSESFGNKQTKVGSLAAGDTREIEIELTFQNAGELSITAGATSEKTGLTAASDIKVHVSEVELETACRIPERQIQGAFANYTFTVENVGSIAAMNSICEIALPENTIVANLPQGMKMVNDKLVWEISTLQPKSENTIDLMLQLNALGEQPVALVAKNNHGDVSTCEAKVLVDTISDLKLTVIDPVAPAPVSETVTYELVIHNRGAKPARDVVVVAQFSSGIEPTGFTGEDADLVPGQVIFKPIKEVPAGEKVTLTINAVAGSAGMHRFRAEVQCDGGETLLVQEESTRYLATAARPDTGAVRR